MLIAMGMVLVSGSMCMAAADANVPAVVSNFIDNMAKGDFTAATKDFDKTMKEKATPEFLKQIWEDFESKYGKFEKITGDSTKQISYYTAHFVKCSFKKGDLTLRVVLNKSNQISGYFIDNAEPK
jgi:hypothetical protein